MTQTTIIGRVLLGVLYTSIAVAILATAMLAVSPKSVTTQDVVLAGRELIVWVADTPTLREKGLGNYKSLKDNEGMLFVFENPEKYGFWMKDMLLPIDIIWFDSNRKIVDVWENATPESYPKVYTPRADAKYVIEVRAGFLVENKLKAGDVLELDSSARYTR